MRVFRRRCTANAALCSLLLLVSACSGGGSTPAVGTSPPRSSGGGAFTIDGNPASITEFHVTGDTMPEAIAVALDGNPWFLTLSHVDRMMQDGAVTAFTGPPAPDGTGGEFVSYSPANDITIGPDNAVWFTADGAGPSTNPTGCEQVGLLTIAPSASAGTTARTVSCPGARQHGETFQSGIVAGPGGNIWMVDQNGAPLGSDGSAYQSITTAGTIVIDQNFPAPCTDFGTFQTYIATGITVGRDHAVYAVAGSPCGGTSVSFASNAVIRIDASGNVTNVFLVPDAIRIAAGPDGNLWVTQNGPTNSVARITPAGAVTEFPIPTPNANPLGITAGNDGAIWFTELGASKIGRITTGGVLTEYPTPTANAGPYGIASLPGACGPGHGLIWFTESTAGNVGKIAF